MPRQQARSEVNSSLVAAAGSGRSGQHGRTTLVRITGRLGRSYCSRNSSNVSPDRRSMLSTSSQAGSTAAVAQLQGRRDYEG